LLYKKKNKLYCLENKNSDNILFLNYFSSFLKTFSVNNFVKLKLVGIGFKVEKNKNVLEFKLGKSHKIFYNIPSHVSIHISDSRESVIIISGFN
jgi:hypothetical protein